MSITFAPTLTGGPQINMANGNATQILDLLGLDREDCWGRAPAEDFLGRVLLAQALLDVGTDDAHGRPEIRDGNWTYGARQPGYLAMRLAELHEVATWACQRHARVTWG